MKASHHTSVAPRRGLGRSGLWPLISLLVVVAVVSPFAALCFADGHVGVEAMLAPHQLALGPGPMGDEADSRLTASAATSHGPCVDTLVEPAVASRATGLFRHQVSVSADLTDLAASADQQGPELLLHWLTASALDTAVAQSVRSTRSTVLRF